MVACDEASILGPALFLGIPEAVLQAGLIVALGIGRQLPPGDKEALDKLGQGNGCCRSRFSNHFIFCPSAFLRLKKFLTQTF